MNFSLSSHFKHVLDHLQVSNRIVIRPEAHKTIWRYAYRRIGVGHFYNNNNCCYIYTS